MEGDRVGLDWVGLGWVGLACLTNLFNGCKKLTDSDPTLERGTHQAPGASFVDLLQLSVTVVSTQAVNKGRQIVQRANKVVHERPKDLGRLRKLGPAAAECHGMGTRGDVDIFDLWDQLEQINQPRKIGDGGHFLWASLGSAREVQGEGLTIRKQRVCTMLQERASEEVAEE